MIVVKSVAAKELLLDCPEESEAEEVEADEAEADATVVGGASSAAFKSRQPQQ